MDVWFYSRIETAAERPTHALNTENNFTALIPIASGELLPLDTDLS